MFNTAMAVALRAAPREKQLAFTGAILPAKPPIDKIAAYAVIQINSRTALDGISFHDSNVFSEKEMHAWERDGIVPIDVGSRKYHKKAESSATEWTIDRYHLSHTPGIEKLIELINKNNRTGNLKGSKYAVPALVRKFYELEECLKWHASVVWAGADVVTAFVKATDVVAAGSPRTDQLDKKLARLAKRLGGDESNEFTLAAYIENLWLIGTPSETIWEKMVFWRDGLRRLGVEKRRAERKWREMKNDRKKLARLEFRAGRYLGIILRTDNRFLVRAVTREKLYAIRIIVASDGHTVIATNRLDLRPLAEEFSRHEHGRWHYNAQMGALINGGPQYVGVRPTGISVTEIIARLKYYLAPDEKKK